MAGEIPPLNIKVNIDTSTVTVGVAKATDALNQITGRAKRMNTAFGEFKSMAIGVFGGNLLTQGMLAFTNALTEAKNGVMADEVAMRRLDQALNNVGITSQKTRDTVLETADAYYQLGFAGDDSITAMGSLISLTKDADQATRLLALSADYARYNQISHTAAASLLGKATMGNVKALKELGITLDDSLPKNKAVAKAMNELNDKIGGQAAAYAKTFAGQMAILKEKFDNLLQVVATKVLPALSAFLGFLMANGKALMIYGTIVLSVIGIIKVYGATLAAVKAVQQAYAFWTYAQAASTNVFRFALQSLWATMKANPVGFIIAALVALGAAFVYAWNRFEGFRKGVVKGLQIVVNAFGYLVGAVGKALGALGRIPGMGWAKNAGKQVDKLADSVRKYSDSLDSLANKKINTPKIPGFVKPGDDTGITGNIQGGDAASKAGGGGTQNTQFVTVYASNTNDIYKKLSKAAKTGVPIGGGR